MSKTFRRKNTYFNKKDNHHFRKLIKTGEYRYVTFYRFPNGIRCGEYEVIRELVPIQEWVMLEGDKLKKANAIYHSDNYGDNNRAIKGLTCMRKDLNRERRAKTNQKMRRIMTGNIDADEVTFPLWKKDVEWFYW